MPLERQTKGENFKFSAATWNAFCDAAEKVNAPDLAGGDRSQAGRSTSILWIKNASGADRDRFEVLMLDGPAITPAMNDAEFKNRIYFEAIDWDGSESSTPVVLLQPLADGKTGRGVVLGAAIAKIEINSASDKYAKYSSSHPEYLESTSVAGAIKLLYNPGEGADLAVILIGAGGGVAPVRFNCLLVDDVDGGIGPWDVDNVTMISGESPLADPEDTSEVVQVYNPIGLLGDADAPAKVSWCDDAERYEFDIIKCPA